MACRISKQFLQSSRKVISHSFIKPIQTSFFSTDDGKKSKGKAPESFYDESIEDEKVLLDVVNSLSDGGLESMTSIKVELKKSEDNVESFEEMYNSKIESPEELKEISLMQQMLKDEKKEMLSKNLYYDDDDDNDDDDYLVADHDDDLDDLDESDNSLFEKLPSSIQNSILAPELKDDYDEQEDEIEDQYGFEALKEDFLPDTASEKFHESQQGLRACPGKLQRKGKTGKLGCHKIDLDALSHFNVVELSRFVTNTAEIKGRKDTGLCAKCQRKVAKTIKRSRNFGIMPRLETFGLLDTRPIKGRNEEYHDIIKKSNYKTKTTIL